MNAPALHARAAALAASLDKNRWQLAELAAEAKAEDVPEWASVIGDACDREVSTVYGWARVAEFRAALPQHFPGLRFSHYEAAMRLLPTHGLDAVLDLMNAAQDDHTKVEPFQRLVSDLMRRDAVPDPADPYAGPRHELTAARAAIIAQVDQVPMIHVATLCRVADDLAGVAAALEAEKQAAAEPVKAEA